MQDLKKLLDGRADWYNQPSFIAGDPICIPHSFSKKQDIEIAGFFAATLAWGHRTAIIRSCRRLMQLLHNSPHDFILRHREEDLKPVLCFCHRTFNATDLLYFIQFLKQHYERFDSLEDAFLSGAVQAIRDLRQPMTIEPHLLHFHRYFFSLPEHPERTRKHVSTPARNSACKRLCMFLRWMVRKDEHGVDFGIWNRISPAQLIMPLDVHVARVSYRLRLLSAEKADWKRALLLTETLRRLRPEDPTLYDFALFGLGAEERL